MQPHQTPTGTTEPIDARPPSDTETAHAPEEGGAGRDPSLQGDARHEDHGRIEGPDKSDRHGDYARSPAAGEPDSLTTAGPEIADNLPPEAFRTKADGKGRPTT